VENANDYFKAGLNDAPRAVQELVEQPANFGFWSYVSFGYVLEISNTSPLFCTVRIYVPRLPGSYFSYKLQLLL
jgi:hypothetical protein